MMTDVRNLHERRDLLHASEKRVAYLLKIRRPLVELMAKAYLIGVADSIKADEKLPIVEKLELDDRDHHENLQQLHAIALKRITDLESALGPCGCDGECEQLPETGAVYYGRLCARASYK